MIVRVLHILAITSLAILIGFGSVSLAAEPGEDGIAIDFRDVELTDLIQTISEMTGKNFIYDDTVKGKVSIISPDRMTPDEAYEAFLSVLSVKGFTLVPSGRTNKIVPIRVAKESNLPSGIKVPSGEQYVTQMIRMKYVDASTLATTVLKDLVPKTSHVAAYGPSNTLIITDNAANIERLVRIIHQLDVPTTLEQIEIIPLQYAGAEEMTEIISQLMSRSGGISQPARGKNAATGSEGEATRVIPYPRTNALIVIAAQGELQTIRSLVAQLDQTPPDDRSYINVYYLENADATSLAGTLNEILTGISQKARQEKATQNSPSINLKQVTITADKPTNALIINARPEEYEIIKGIVAKLDIKRKQVFVEALIMELSLDATKNLGISIIGAGANSDGDGGIIGTSNLNAIPATSDNPNPVNLTDFTSDSGGIPSVLGKAVNGLMAGGFLNPTTITGPDGNLITVPALSVLIDLSQSDGDVNILAAPRLLTSDNEEAEIIIGSNIPVITERLTDTTNPSSQSVSVERQDAALTLRFTPQVTEGDEVRLNIHQEITDVASTDNNVGPTLTKRLLRNTVIAENGRTIALGGLISTTVQDTITKVPLLGDIPILGWLFKRKDVIERKTNLLVFITPHIIRSAEDLEEITNKSRQAMEHYRNQKIDFDQPLHEIEKDLSGDDIEDVIDEDIQRN